MARKYDFISELYNRTCKTVVATPASWEAFLRSACYNYRLRFDEQLLVHAQRPDATAVLQIDDWNQKFGRWVNRGAHGIAVFEDADQRRQRLVHYFDISDTHPSRFSRRVPIWQMRDEYTAEVIDTLESTFGELNDKETLAVAIESAARNAVEDNIPDYLPDLLYSVKDSFLDGVSEEEITHIFKTAVRNSVAYMTMTRLGIEAGEYFEPDDLRDVVNFTTPATLNALGYATSDIAEMGLAEISRTILALDRQNRIIAEKTKADYNVGKEKTERSPDDERDHLHEAGGLSAPRSDNAGAARAVDGQVRPDAEEVPEGASQGTLLQPADELRPERASERHGAQSERDGTDADGADGSVGGRDGESESDGYDELGSEDEQYPEPGSGDRDGGGNLRLDYYDRSHEDKSLPFFGGDDTIREILGTTPHLKASKDEIRAFFEATADENARISYIKRIFNNDYTEVILSDGRRCGYKTYQNVLQLWEGSYLSRTAQSFYDWGVIAQHFEAMRLLGELQDTIKPLPSIDGQLSLMTAGAEERKPSAFTFSQEIIDAVLTRGSGISEGKMRIYEQFQKSLSAKENADFLKNEYGWGGAYPVIVGAGIDEQHDGTLTTESLAVFIPFRVQDICHTNGVYYGQNVISKNMIIADRRQLLNGNEFILGVSGGGKSFTAKNEIINQMLSGDSDILLIDPEREYTPLVRALGGEIINISATSPTHINAMDMNREYGDGANPVILKSEFIMSLCEQLIGGNNLGAVQKSIIDRCTANVYRTYQQNNYTGEVPTLQDFRAELLKQSEPEAQEIALAIELFTNGSLNTFAKKTNVDTDNRLICYDILDLGKQLMPIGMLVVLDSILNRITQNRAKGKNTFIFIDEIYLLFQHEYSANFLFTLWKRVRKYGAYATGITQNVDDLLQSHTARTMLANSEFIVMLNQASTDRLELAKLLNISDTQLSYITNVDAGHGLIKVGSSLVPFANKFPKNTKLYKLMTTKPGEGA